MKPTSWLNVRDFWRDRVALCNPSSAHGNSAIIAPVWFRINAPTPSESLAWNLCHATLSLQIDSGGVHGKWRLEIPRHMSPHSHLAHELLPEGYAAQHTFSFK